MAHEILKMTHPEAGEGETTRKAFEVNHRHKGWKLVGDNPTPSAAPADASKPSASAKQR